MNRASDSTTRHRVPTRFDRRRLLAGLGGTGLAAVALRAGGPLAAQDTGTPDIGTPDVGTPDIGVPEIGTPEIGLPGATPAAGATGGTGLAGLLSLMPAAILEEPEPPAVSALYAAPAAQLDAAGIEGVTFESNPDAIEAALAAISHLAALPILATGTPTEAIAEFVQTYGFDPLQSTEHATLGGAYDGEAAILVRGPYDPAAVEAALRVNDYGPALGRFGGRGIVISPRQAGEPPEGFEGAIGAFAALEDGTLVFARNAATIAAVQDVAAGEDPSLAASETVAPLLAGTPDDLVTARISAAADNRPLLTGFTVGGPGEATFVALQHVADAATAESRVPEITERLDAWTLTVEGQEIAATEAFGERTVEAVPGEPVVRLLLTTSPDLPSLEFWLAPEFDIATVLSGS